MQNSSYVRSNVVALLTILAISAVTMLWLFWHHPVSTAFATLAVLAAFGVSARLAHSTDGDVGARLGQGES